MANEEEARVAVGVEMKINLGNYESAGASIGVSNLRVGASQEEIEEALDTAKVSFTLMSKRLNEKVAELRGAK